MGRGQKRGRTQRRHFKQSRENVWKHDNNNKKTRPEDGDGDGAASADNPNPWEPFATQNPAFEEYYKEQSIVPEAEWDEFMCFLRKPLPAAFRINSSGQFFHDIQAQLENDFMKSLVADVTNEYEMEAIRPLPWYPGNLAWHLNFSRMQLRKNQTLERFHEFLKQENEIGNITRQEAVSMVPPLFLEVFPDHHVLDMCAAPGSKTFQLLEMMHQSTKPGSLPNGLVIANDVDVQRCNLLIHQTKRMCSANLIVTNHEAQHFPSSRLTSNFLDICKAQDVEGVPTSTPQYGDAEKSRDNRLLFDRVLCDVPCSGDGTLRKAPDIWRKWNAGMGNGFHHLQVQIAMRGLAVLKVGGRMVYSTCSMNPVENEAVVAEVLRKVGGAVELLDVSDELPELIRRPGLKKWKVRDKGLWFNSYRDVPTYRKGGIVSSMFPSGQSCEVKKALCNDVQVDMETPDYNTALESNSRKQQNGSSQNQGHTCNLLEDTTLADISRTTYEMDEIPDGAPMEGSNNYCMEEVSSFPLERCIRIIPHDQNSGAFFIAVLRKLAPLQVVSENNSSQSKRSANRRHQVPKKNSESREGELKSDTSPENVPGYQQHVSAELASDANLQVKQSDSKSIEVSLEVENNDASSKENKAEEGVKAVKGRSQIQGKWRGVDPVLLFRDDTTINSIRTFYGIAESFPLDDHLVTRNNDANHVKRIYYISKSVHDVLKLNFEVGQPLKITSVGLKIFERQTSKDAYGSSPCAFRISSEGLPLLLPYISKQVLSASLNDFQNLLKYRSIKFSEFVDVDFGEKASKLSLGCCVVVLNEGDDGSTGNVAVDDSRIAIGCWKGKTNLSVMVSQMDSQELLERVSKRFGTGKLTSAEENGNVSMVEETDTVESKDAEPSENLEAAVQEIC